MDLLTLHLAHPALNLNIPLLVALGLVAGVLSGFFGIGGGWVVTPVLNFLGMPIADAIGTGLAYIFGTSLISMFRHSRQGNVSVKIGLCVVLTMLAGMKAGQFLVSSLGMGPRAESLVHWLYILFFMVLGGLMCHESLGALRHAAPAPAGENRLARWLRGASWRPHLALPGVPDGRVSVWTLLGIGVVGGLLAGTLGLGGGVIVVPALVYLVGLPTRMAVGTSLFCIFCSSPVGAFLYAQHGQVPVSVAAVMVGGALVGAPLGVAATKYLRGAWLRLLYGGTLVLGGVAVALKEFWNLGRVALVLTVVTAGSVAFLVLALAWRNRRQAAAAASSPPASPR